jgi:hypothetical protein
MMHDVELTPSRLAELVLRAHVNRLRGQAFVQTRHVTQKSTYDTLEQGTELGRSMRGHVAGLLWARLAQPYDERVEAARSDEHPEVAFKEAPQGSVDQLAARVITGSVKTVQDALTAMSRAGGAVHEAFDEREAVRREIGARMGLVLAEDAALPVAAPALAGAAQRFFERTQDVARSVILHFERGLGRESYAAEILVWLRGTQLQGLPARLSHRWLREVLPEFATPRLDPRSGAPLPRLLLQTLPPLLGVTSFARALGRLGEAVVLGAPLEPVEWVRRVDGAFLAPARTGLAFAALLTEPAFLARATDASAGEREAFARALHVAGLFEARALAARLFTRPNSRAGIEEVEAQLWVRPLPRGVYGLVPRWRDDASTRFCAWLDRPAFRDKTLSLFDEDWFRNPRSRSWAMLPPPPEADFAEHVDASCDRLATHFESVCG